MPTMTSEYLAYCAMEELGSNGYFSPPKFGNIFIAYLKVRLHRFDLDNFFSPRTMCQNKEYVMPFWQQLGDSITQGIPRLSPQGCCFQATQGYIFPGLEVTICCYVAAYGKQSGALTPIPSRQASYSTKKLLSQIAPLWIVPAKEPGLDDPWKQDFPSHPQSWVEAHWWEGAGKASTCGSCSCG